MKKFIYVVYEGGELNFYRMTRRKAESLVEKHPTAVAVFGPFEHHINARREVIKHMLNLAENGKRKEAEELLKFLFEPVIIWK